MGEKFSGVRSNYLSKETVEGVAEYIRDIITDDTIIVNIGTDKCIGDSLAPMVGTILQEQGCSLPVYGTLAQPIHAINISKRLEEIKRIHPHSTVIAIDACLGYSDCVGDIQISEGFIQPGKGVGKTLPKVGDYKLVGVVDSIDNSDVFSIRNTRMSFIYDMAKVIAKSILIATNDLKQKQEIAMCRF